jgi:hypothetical protein
MSPHTGQNIVNVSQSQQKDKNDLRILSIKKNPYKFKKKKSKK